MEDFVVLYHDYDLLVIPLTFIFFYILGKSISSRIQTREFKNYFIYGLLLKMAATIIFGLVIQYYFKGGDTNRYYVALLDMKQAVNDDPANLLEIYSTVQLKPGSPLVPYFVNDKLGDNLGYLVKASNFQVPRFGVLFSFIFGSSYTAISMCYSFFAFWGSWKCFTVFASLFPHIRKGMAICFLFFPSVVYWGSAITKDSVCLGSLGLFVYSFYHLFFNKKLILLHAASIIFWGAILFFTKPYILLSVVPALALWFFLKVNRGIKEKSLRYASFVVLFAIIGGAVMFLIQFMLRSEFLEAGQYKAQNINQYVSSAQLGYNQAGGSVFDIGTLDGSIGSFLLMFPKAVNASLFRPYLWEVNSPVMLISAFESFIIFYLFLLAIIKLGFKKFFSSIFSSPILVFMFVYSFFLSGLVAITTNNFGSLVRYKIPVMPFFLAMIIILLSQIPGIKRNKLVSKYIFGKNKN